MSETDSDDDLELGDYVDYFMEFSVTHVVHDPDSYAVDPDFVPSQHFDADVHDQLMKFTGGRAGVYTELVKQMYFVYKKFVLLRKGEFTCPEPHKMVHLFFSQIPDVSKVYADVISGDVHRSKNRVVPPVEKPKEVVELIPDYYPDGSYRVYSDKRVDSDFHADGRYYAYDPDLPRTSSLQAINDYDKYLKNLPQSVEKIRDLTYEDIESYTKVTSYRSEQAATILASLRFKRYIIPGDGLGLFSLAARRLNLCYYSSEPNAVGATAYRLGLISSTLTLEDVLEFAKPDDCLILSNLELYVNIPSAIKRVEGRGVGVVYFDEQRKAHAGLMTVPYTSGRLSANFTNFKFDSTLLDYNHRVNYKWLERVGRNRFGTRQFRVEGTTPYLNHCALEFNMLQDKPLDTAKIVILGTGPDMVNIKTKQDYMTPNMDTGYTPSIMGKDGQVVCVSGVVQPWASRMCFLTPRSYQVVNGRFREDNEVPCDRYLKPGTMQSVTFDFDPARPIQYCRFSNFKFFVFEVNRQYSGPEVCVNLLIYYAKDTLVRE